MIQKGVRFLDEHRIGELQQEGHFPATIHLILQLHGAGVPTTKQGFKIQAKNNLAGIPLSEGYELRWVGNYIG